MSDDDQLLLTFLRGRDVACPLCQYNLRDLSMPRCPECGRELKLAVGMVQPYMSAWVTLAITLCASGAMGLLFIALMIKDGLPRWGGDRELLLNTCFFFHILTVPLAIVVLVWRRRLMRLGRRMQWVIARIALLLCATMFLLFAVYVT